MMDRPIIFSAPMIQALLAGRKTMTRRLATSPLRRAEPGDRLWVRESIRAFQRTPHATAQYMADITGVLHRGEVSGGADGRAYWQWPEKKAIPSIHMPRWASRLTLIVTSFKIERLQDITADDAIAEGCRLIEDGLGAGFWIVDGAEAEVCAESPIECFERLWTSLHGPDAWDANPEVVALTFVVHRQNIDTLAKEEA